MIAPILILFFMTLTLYYVVNKSLSKKPLYSREPELKLNYSTKNWSAVDYFSAITFVNILVLIYTASFIKMGLDLPHYLRWMLLIWTSVCTLILTNLFFNITTRYSAFAGPLKLIATLATVVFGLLAAPVVDSSITNYTHVEASQFPLAQKTLTFVGVVYLWGYSLSLISICIYPVLFFLLIKDIGPSNKPKENSENVSRQENWVLLPVVVGLSFTVVISLNGMLALSEELSKKRIKELFVYSSFHLNPQACGIKEKPEGALVAIIKDKQAVLAIPDEKFVYKFTTEPCTPQPVMYNADEAKMEAKQASD